MRLHARLAAPAFTPHASEANVSGSLLAASHRAAVVHPR
eukprot:CAMPEP_0177678314 /NCGR_PEP_ID=MMETSP0447-20121125/28944_1 /TAXON_ID=0 /ORGANISM="Stygamoeba regulata, Strain BSH-02190019" /LENGTH=38 /DNA_ID= /DNA_START= /DNA_END= /DNA_ORIENTATION=